jgi:hypothetical protein
MHFAEAVGDFFPVNFNSVYLTPSCSAIASRLLTDYESDAEDSLRIIEEK